MKDNDGSELLAGADQYNGRDPQGHYSTEQDGLIAVRCADFTTPAPSAQEVQSAYNELEAGAPILNSDLAPSDLAQPMCANWPFQTTEKPHQIKAQGSDTDPGRRHHRRPGDAVSERCEPGGRLRQRAAADPGRHRPRRVRQRQPVCAVGDGGVPGQRHAAAAGGALHGVSHV